MRDNRTRKDGVAGLALGGQRFARQRRLIHFNGIAWEKARVAGDNVTQAEADYIALDQLTHRKVGPLAIALDLGAVR